MGLDRERQAFIDAVMKPPGSYHEGLDGQKSP
jgi:hypothetical protein